MVSTVFDVPIVPVPEDILIKLPTFNPAVLTTFTILPLDPELVVEDHIGFPKLLFGLEMI